jgi:hypothetical protein
MELLEVMTLAKSFRDKIHKMANVQSSVCKKQQRTNMVTIYAKGLQMMEHTVGEIFLRSSDNSLAHA